MTTIDGGNAASNAIDNADSTGAVPAAARAATVKSRPTQAPPTSPGIAGGSATVIPATGVA
ncbi:hypothetical protein, partial [Mycolicibacterium insubricum]|uniref:hypothetical protein n=1 Tax=Mycolicibacterium insubricum TaxID=444597 RepID=UPI0021F277A5